MLPKVLAGCLIGAFVTMILPRELVARWVGHESGFTGLAVAAFFGFLLPGGPITIYPVAGAFLTMGADAGAVVAFITAWTLMRLYPRAGVGIAVLRSALRDLAHRRGTAAADPCRASGAHRHSRWHRPAERQIMFLAVNILLWLVVAVLAFTAALRGRVLFTEGAREGVLEFVRLLPRIGAGVIGSGFIAEVLPKALVASWIGPGSGFVGVVIATLGGALTPGGPVVGFAIGAAALKSGAGAPQVIAYSTAWALYAIHRLVIWEVPMMPARVVWLRAAVSLPLPFIAAAMAMMLALP